MKVELEEVQDFIASWEPFSHLPEDDIAAYVRQMEMIYVRAGEEIIHAGKDNSFLYIIRSGAVDVLSAEGALLDRREAGRAFGYSTLDDASPSAFTMVAVEDSLLLLLAREQFLTLCADHPQVSRFYSSKSQRMHAAAAKLREKSGADALRTTIAECMTTSPEWCSPDTAIHQAAAQMARARVSSLLIVDSDSHESGAHLSDVQNPNGEAPGVGVMPNARGLRLRGIVTDKDFTKKVVATARDVCDSITEVMTPHPLTISSSARAFEAMLAFAQHRIHHLPVVDRGQLVGIVTSGDIMRLLRDDPIFVHADLARAATVAELARAYASAHDVAVRFIERGADPSEVSGVLTLAADALIQRVIQLTEAEIGPAPIPYCFAVLGSHGRHEMGLASDQDNAIILHDSYDESEHGEYFARLGQLVCERLDEAGQKLCPGDMMASNPEWRMTLEQWQRTFHTWVSAPEPDALLHAQVFFDMRGVSGEVSMATQLMESAYALAHDARRMHAHLAALAARRDAPLGFFRGFVVDKGGKYANTLDAKKGGTATVVQMARLFALSAPGEGKARPLSTTERLRWAMDEKWISSKGGADLVDSFHFLNSVILRHQAEQHRAGTAPGEVDYHIDPKQLSTIERQGLRDAFSLIRSMQTALVTKYPVRNI